MSKDKKKKKDKKGGGGGNSLKALAQNPLVADVVAAALVATASALKDSKRARALASDAGEELSKLSKANAERGSAMWDLALQIGRRSLEALTSDDKPKRAKPKSGSKPKASAKPKSPAKKSSKRPARAASR